jgi:hypothetical protein
MGRCMSRAASLARLLALCLLSCGGGTPDRDQTPLHCPLRTDAGLRVCCGYTGELPGLSCLDLTQDGGEYGIYGHCIENGEEYDAKVVGARCCPGLISTATYIAGCGDEGILSLRRCLPCGDGRCDGAENACNCPADCM